MSPDRTRIEQLLRSGRETLYALGETAASLRHHIVMTLGIVLAVGVSLTLFGGGLLIQRQVDLVTSDVYDQIEVSIFLCTGDLCDLDPDDVETLADALADDPRISGVEFETQEAAYATFAELFADRPELVAATPPDALPASFRVRLTDATQFADVATAYGTFDGVDEVVDQRDLLETLFAVAELIVRAAWSVSLVQLTAALVLVYTSVRIAAVNRRPQTTIMKHLGASNRYIRTPFMLEAVFGATLGALASTSLLWWATPQVVARSSSVLQVPFVDDRDLAIVGATLVGVGATTALITAWFALRRHLRV